MGGGYHSRSPEELREYLDSLNRTTKKRPWMQYIIFANIIGILFVMFVIFQEKGIGSGVTFKASNKINMEEFEIYFTKSNEITTDSISYFIFVKNKSLTENTFPNKDLQVLFTLTTDEKEECLQKNIPLQYKQMNPSNTEFFSFSINANEIKKTETCDTFFHRINKKGFKNFFSKGNSKFTPDLILINKNQIYRMSIQN